jgi:hypothetical protein
MLDLDVAEIAFSVAPLLRPPPYPSAFPLGAVPDTGLASDPNPDRCRNPPHVN